MVLLEDLWTSADWFTGVTVLWSTYLGIHHIGCDIDVCNVLAKFAPQLGLDLLEVQRCQASSRTTIDPGFVSNDHAPQGLRETTDGLSQIALEEFNYRRREVKLVCALENLSFGKRVLCHPLSKVSDDLGRWRDFDDIAALDAQVSSGGESLGNDVPTRSFASIYFFLTSVSNDHHIAYRIS